MTGVGDTPRDLGEYIRETRRRLVALERRQSTNDAAAEPPKTKGSTALRDNYFGIPANPAERAALANSRPIWYNTTLSREETYYAVTGTAGLTVPGLLAGSTPGWYVTPAGDMGGKSGPSSQVAIFRVSWSRGWSSPGSTIDTATHATRILIRMDGLYEVHSFLRAGSQGANEYQALALDGNRDLFEGRSGSGGTPGTMVGVWTHDHGAVTNNFSVSHYWGQLYAGDLITAGPSTMGGTMPLSSAASSGAMIVNRYS